MTIYGEEGFSKISLTIFSPDHPAPSNNNLVLFIFLYRFFHIYLIYYQECFSQPNCIIIKMLQITNYHDSVILFFVLANAIAKTARVTS